MAHCANCHRMRFLWSLDDDMLCKDCANKHRIAKELADRKREEAVARHAAAANRILSIMPEPAPGSPEAYYFKIETELVGDDFRTFFRYKEIEPLNFFVDIQDKEWVAIHIATTGLDEGKDDLIAIGAVIVKDSIPIAEFYKLIKPTTPVPDTATQINGITNEMLSNAGDVYDVLPEFVEFVGRRPCVGHNLKFLYSFLLAATQRADLPTIALTSADSLSISRKYWPDLHNHRLISLEYLFYHKNERQPTALYQARVIMQIVIEAQKLAAQAIHNRTIEKRVLKTISDHSPILQKELQSLLPNDTAARVSAMVTKLSIEGRIIKETQGNTFLLSIPQPHQAAE